MEKWNKSHNYKITRIFVRILNNGRENKIMLHTIHRHRLNDYVEKSYYQWLIGKKLEGTRSKSVP